MVNPMTYEINKFNLQYVLESMKYKVEPEYKFCKDRKFRADWKVSKNNKSVLIEYEGLMSQKARHTNIKGYTTDCEKYNLMTKMGYKLLRYTVFNINNVINDVEEVLE